MATPGYAPPGWPAEVRPPGVPGWETEAVAWLLDWSPPSWRQDPTLTRHPAVLARFTLAHLHAQVAAARRAWTHTNTTPAVTATGNQVDSNDVAGRDAGTDQGTRAALLDMLARVGTDLNRRVVAAELLHDALLSGRRWTPRI